MKELDRESVNTALKSSKPVAIFFYMTGCPHCERMEPIWNELEKDMKDQEFAKVESANVPPELGITGFPTFKKGKTTLNGEMSKEALKGGLFGGGRRRRSRSTRRHIPLRTKLASTRKRRGRMVRRI